jgi:hypothetical protein
LFAGADAGGRHWAIVATLIQSAKLNNVDPAVLNADESQLQSLPGWLPFGARRVW